MYLNRISGWMSKDELDFLYNLAKKMESIVEVGSWKGRSTHALLSGCQGKVYAIDHFRGSASENQQVREASAKDIYAEFRGNVGGFDNLEVLKISSVEATEQFENKSVDMVFIDADHSYEMVKADIEAWLPKAKKMICGHDYWFGGVNKAVKELFGSNIKTFSGIWIKEIE